MAANNIENGGNYVNAAKEALGGGQASSLTEVVSSTLSVFTSTPVYTTSVTTSSVLPSLVPLGCSTEGAMTCIDGQVVQCVYQQYVLTTCGPGTTCVEIPIYGNETFAT